MNAVDFDVALLGTLLGDEKLDGLVGGKVFAIVVPKGTRLPCVSFQRISGRPTHVLGGFSGLEHITVQIDVWATTLSEAKAVAKAVRDAMPARGPEWGARLSGDADLYESETNYFRIRMEWSVWMCESED